MLLNAGDDRQNENTPASERPGLSFYNVSEGSYGSDIKFPALKIHLIDWFVKSRPTVFHACQCVRLRGEKPEYKVWSEVVEIQLKTLTLHRKGSSGRIGVEVRHSGSSSEPFLETFIKQPLSPTYREVQQWCDKIHRSQKWIKQVHLSYVCIIAHSFRFLWRLQLCLTG